VSESRKRFRCGPINVKRYGLHNFRVAPCAGLRLRRPAMKASGAPLGLLGDDLLVIHPRAAG
jgi:hypothetical protein